ncbi:extracellular solute-binding protein [Streptomyces alkaliphilus]|uniref:Extracellular solute-binding protein n=1 Tax=Streptomyces alkaliphilus TaxID=1472722 RepID=A0A7W3TCT8_9ACTN|nr:extracellular solute-binding protein [Streptomyces alkaliphilus]MBB0244417.1 extracellular solute-binding protein [Streptomyces alkaliphilus]
MRGHHPAHRDERDIPTGRTGLRTGLRSGGRSGGRSGHRSRSRFRPVPDRARTALPPRARRTALTGLLAIALAAGTTACASEEEVTVTVLAADFGQRVVIPTSEFWDDVIDRFEEENPNVTVEVELVPWETADTVLAERVAAGEPPDIAQAGSFAEYAADDLLYSASDLLPLTTQADFHLPLARAGEYRWEQYGIPFISSTPRLFVNLDLLERAGVEEPPTDWSELLETARALREVGVSVPYALQFGPDGVHEEALVWMLGAGGGYTNTGDHYAIDSEENVEALEWLRDNLIAEGLTGPPPAELDRATSYGGFFTGEVGMMMGHPAMLVAMEQAGVNHAHVPFPSRDGGPGVPTGISDWLVAFRGPGHEDEVGAFLEFLYRPENHAFSSGRHGTVPTTVSGSQLLLEDEDHRHLWEFVEQMPRAELQPLNKHSWPAVRGLLLEHLNRAVGPDGDPAAVLAEIQALAEEESGADGGTSEGTGAGG